MQLQQSRTQQRTQPGEGGTLYTCNGYCDDREGGREGSRKGRREGGREGWRERGKEGERDRGREGGRE